MFDSRKFAMLGCFFFVSACGGGGSPSEGEAEAESEAECELEDCDDGVDCTDDQLNAVECACANIPLHARCPLGQICDVAEGCVSPPPCGKTSDCPDRDEHCLQGFCDLSTASCVYTPLDNDGDGHSPRRCVSVGGDDCDDTPTCEFSEDGGCDRDEMDGGSLTYPGAEELCDGRDNDCNGEIDDLPELGMPCDGWDDDECAEGGWECNFSPADGGYYELNCTDDTNSTVEVCNGEDDDCNGEIDESVDHDGDGDYTSCSGGGDCDDDNPDINTWAIERCDGADNDCDGQVDENWPEFGAVCDDPSNVDLCVEGVYVCNDDGSGLECEAEFECPSACPPASGSIDDQCACAAEHYCECCVDDPSSCSTGRADVVAICIDDPDIAAFLVSWIPMSCAQMFNLGICSDGEHP